MPKFAVSKATVLNINHPPKELATLINPKSRIVIKLVYRFLMIISINKP